MSDDQFTKLFKYMEKRFDAIEAELSRKADAAQVDSVLNALDALADGHEVEEHERLANGRELGWYERMLIEKLSADPRTKAAE
ncbi:hypothetical protein [Parafrankia sp. FMc2]|uniref:hypothetical protein n=1 Tax=Parafrankia sp. FMc2 TaxID=3233196 RepID=UPI0034D73AEF